MKRFIAVLLILSLLTGILTGCASLAADVGMINLTQEMGEISEGESNIGITINSSEIPAALNGATLNITSTFSRGNGDMNNGLSLSVLNPQATVQLTELIRKGDATYVNAEYLCNILSGSFLGGRDLDTTESRVIAASIVEALDGAKYVRQGPDTSGDGGAGQVDETQGEQQPESEQSTSEQAQGQVLEDIVYDILTAMFTSVHELGIAKKTNGTYGFIAEGNNFKIVLLDILNGINENMDSYADTIWNSVGFVNLNGLSDELAGLNQDSFRGELKKFVENSITALEDGDFTGCSLSYSISYDKKISTYTYSLKVVNNAANQYTLNGTLTEKTIDSVAEPADHINMDDFIARFEDGSANSDEG